MSEMSYLPEIKEGTEFKINELLSVKFEEKQTRVYVNKKYFRQCIRLFLNISLEQMDSYDEINSIDEAVDIEKQLSLWENRFGQKFYYCNDPSRHELKHKQLEEEHLE